MNGPIGLVRSDRISGYNNLGPIHEWSEGRAYLTIDRITFDGTDGALLCYNNPPVHQVGNPGLDAYLEGLDKVSGLRDDLSFLILYGANDPVHAGGDLKESLANLDRTNEIKTEKEAAGAPPEEVDRLYDWADKRLEKGFALYRSIRGLAGDMRVVALCGGGTRFGGSAEIPLMADILVGDSRSGMCFSEAMIGLVPGWAGVGRALTKAGPENAAYMALTSREVKAPQLGEIGIYNDVVEVPFPFPRRPRTDNPQADRDAYADLLDAHNRDTGLLLLPRGLQAATCPPGEIPELSPGSRRVLATREEIAREVERRKTPENYAQILGRPLREVKDELAELGRPLAPQSVEAIQGLLSIYDPAAFDEAAFVRAETEADERVYRDPRLRAGLIATLEQRVADFRG